MKKILVLFALVMLVGVSSAFAQARKITGTVVDKANKSPLPGVSVALKGTTTGTATDINGEFTISVNTGDVLVISFVGMKSQEITITNQTRLKVELESERVAVEEVMVVAYGVAKKESFTGAAQKVGADALADTRVESLDKALSGKVSGVRVSSASGDPGAGGDIQIRGIGSITGSTAPLYVIDGVPVVSEGFGHFGASSSVLSTINPDDIESMTILKDAAAASLYGSRAANGVVIITTKKGKTGEAKFKFKANYGWSKMATDSYEFMGGKAIAQYTKSALEGWYLNRNQALIPGQANYGDAAIIADAIQFGLDNYLDKDNWSGIDKDQNGENWHDIIYDEGSDQEIQFSVSSGGEISKMYVSLGYKEVDGIVRTYGFKRLSGVLNVDSKPREWLDLSFKTQLAYTKQDGRRDQSDQQQGIGTAAPLGMLFAANPTEFAYNADGTLNLNSSYSSKVKNPLFALAEDQSVVNTKTYRALNTGMARIKPIPELTITSTNSADYTDVKIFEYWGPESIDGESVNGLGDRRNNQVISLTTSNVVQYVKTFEDDHNFDVLAGFELQKFENLLTVTTANDYATTKLPELAVGKPDDARSYKFKYFIRSYFGNLKYNYMNKYYGQVSLRSDESSKLGKDNRRGTFWSVSGMWRFTKEDFMANDVITDGKLRVSYGTNGTLPGAQHDINGFPVGIYDHLTLYDFAGKYAGANAIFWDQPENKDLSWELSNNLNVGVDLTFWERFSMSLEYFQKNTKDLLLYVPVTYVTGFDESLQNVGELSNKGIDMEFHAVDILNHDQLKWNVDLTFSTLKAKMEELPGGKDIILGDGNLYLYSEGKDLYTFYLPTYVGVEDETGLAQFLIDPSLPATDSNLTYSYSQAQRGPVDKAYPDISGGLTNSFSWKGITLRFLTTFQWGGNLFDYGGYFAHHDGVRLGGFNLAKDVENNYWTQPGDKVENPRPVAWFGNRPDRWSTRHIHSTDYIRLKEASISYNIPKHLITKYGVDNINISLSANNLAYLYAATDDMELEVNLNGYRTVDTPLARTITFGIAIDF